MQPLPLGLGPELLDEVETLRLLAVTRGILLHPLEETPALSALIASWLWSAATSCHSLELSHRLGAEVDQVAFSILFVAAGNHIAADLPPSTPAPRGSSRHALEAAEELMEMISPLITPLNKDEILSTCTWIFATANPDDRFAAVLDVLESHLGA